MAKRSSKVSGDTKASAAIGDGLPMDDIRHPAAKRKNNPPATLASEGSVPLIAKAEYAYNPHLPPVLRFDQHGTPDKLAAVAAKVAAGDALSPEERELASLALRTQGSAQPWLEWTGKRERPAFTVDPVALHIHERVGAVNNAEEHGSWIFHVCRDPQVLERELTHLADHTHLS